MNQPRLFTFETSRVLPLLNILEDTSITFPLVAAIETVLDRILLALTATYASPAATKPPATTAIGYALRLMSDLVLHTQSATTTEAGTTLSSTLLERVAGFVLRPCLFGNGVLWVLCCY